MSSRKSSVGVARRVAPKAHVPYRADDLGVGKKTGVTVARVDRKSDGFEPFQDVVDLMDKAPPPRVKKMTKMKRKSSIPVAQSDGEDENGEMSMELTDTPPGAAYALFTNDHRPDTSGVGKRALSVSRRPRTSDVDFDEVPSQPPRASSSRQSLVNGSNTVLAASSGPQPPSSDPTTANDGFNDNGFDGYDQPEDNATPASSPAKTSFTGLAAEDDADEQDEPEPETSPIRAKKDKGKRRAISPDDEAGDGQDVEEEIARGLDEMGMEEDEDDDDDEPTGKKRRTDKQQKAVKRAPPKTKYVVSDSEEPSRGVRRSRRHRYAPLEWWRLEKVVYGKPDANVKIWVPHIKEIVRIPKEPTESLGKFKRKRSVPPRGKSQTVEPPTAYNPEEDWDKDTKEKGVILDFYTREEVERRIAFTARMVAPKAAAGGEWFFQKIFGDGDFIAAGQLIIPPKVTKPSKGTKDNTYIFYVIEGAIRVRIHNTSLVLATGGMFLAPRGNNYFIENISERNAKLFFTQARKVAMTEEEQASATQLGAAPRRSLDSQRPTSRPPADTGRSSSVGLQMNGRSSSRAPTMSGVKNKA